MKFDLDEIKKSFEENLAKITNSFELEQIKNEFLGRKGKITLLLKNLKNLTLEEKKKWGPILKELALEAGAELQKIQNKIEKEILDIKLNKVSIDLNQKGEWFSSQKGSYHLINFMFRQLTDVFSKLGYDIVEGPQIETDYYNFEVLNMDKNHPARDSQDTFYFDAVYLLRTHTTNLQGHILENKKLPIKYVTFGPVYRRDDDLTHTPMFHQVDGLVVDYNLTLADLKGTLAEMMRNLIDEKLNLRFRSSFFPFTEPSLEVDISCVMCGGEGCSVCKQTGWLEMGGAGLVHPKVFQNVGIFDENISGIAFGFGIERPLMIRHKINNIRLFFENDVRFLSQFKESL